MKLLTLVVLIVATFAVNCRRSDIKEKSTSRSFVSDILAKFDSEFETKKKKCEDKKKSNEVPSGKIDSPLETYGYPNFDENTKSVTVHPGATLMLSNKVKQPIRIGSRDYVISGKAEEIVAFFECFGDYDIIGSELNLNGSWPDNTGQIKIELQNIFPGDSNFKNTLFETMFDLSMDAILKTISPAGKVYASGYEVIKALKPIMDYLPSQSDFIEKATEIYVKMISEDEKKKEMLNWLKEQDKSNKQMWKKPENIKKNDKLLMSLVMYTKPEKTIRATYNTGMSKISMKEIANILKLFFKI
ncbi:uncharacterized protein LOC100202753 isoform X1 [Hydra vulgaris]|uniref:uncharacterized protein LOC100202753 isoform X1 n=1 Tax=Hydra vulgaris TaxID=6087 RepID=UPI001F5E6C0A|nr:uncharacterized protein LOC100202753 [Hydra vulgaris]XP_047141958.1 uncharacterized protein LOC100202753 [Hydra vulgaris]